jgi:hypothetical protein
MCKNRNSSFENLPSLSMLKSHSTLYRRKLALNIKETFDKDPITEADIKDFPNVIEIESRLSLLGKN